MSPAGRHLHGLSWSAAYLVTTRASAVIAVPIILHQLGADLYAAWVLGGTLVMAQGLIDLGITAATTRYVALGFGAGSRSLVVDVVRKTLIFYLALSAVVGGLLVALRGPLVAAVPALDDPAAASDGRTLIVYVAVAFGLSNLVLVSAAVLQGLDQVGRSFRAQTLGWMVYVPLLAGTLAADGGVHALGVAWIGSFALQVALMAPALMRSVRALPRADDRSVSNREMLSVGGRWQASSWADFASFQLPRIVAGVALSSAAVVQVDLAMRAAQIVVAPFFAALPLVLPAASRLWGAEGRARVDAVMRQWSGLYSVLLLLAGAAALPLLVPAVALWTGRDTSGVDFAVVALVLVGTVAHSWTGVVTSVLLAAGDLGPVVRYKTTQLVMAAILLPAGGALGVRWLAGGLAVSMTAPAAIFMRRAGVAALGAQALTGAALVAGPAAAVVALAPDDVSPALALAAGAGLVAAGAGAALHLHDLRSTLDGLRFALRRRGDTA